VKKESRRGSSLSPKHGGGKSAPKSLPMAHMKDIVDAPGGDTNNSMLPINKSRKGFLSARNNMQKSGGNRG